MQWNLEGLKVSGSYLGRFPYTGVVESSRVKYGGSVQHTVRVDEPFAVYGQVRDRLLVDTNELGEIGVDRGPDR